MFHILKDARERMAAEEARHDRAWARFMKARARYMAKASFRSSQSMLDASDAVARSHQRLEDCAKKLKAAEKKWAEQEQRRENWARHGVVAAVMVAA